MRIKKGDWFYLLYKLEMRMRTLIVMSDYSLFFSKLSELQLLLEDALVLQRWIEEAGASSRVLQLLLAQLEAEVKRNGIRIRIPYLLTITTRRLGETFTAFEFDLMRKELDLVPSPWETFEEEVQVYAVVVLALLSLVYHYLAGCIDRGGTKTYSPGSLEFRSTYISIVLFQGAYIWIKFRDGAPPSKRGGYRRPVTDKLSGIIKPSDKIEARYTPPRKSGDHNHIYLGLCATHEEAETKKTIAAFYYGGRIRRLDFDDGRSFLIPPMPTEQEQGLSVAKKREWVKDKVRAVYEEIKALRAFDTNTVHLNACHRSSLLAAKSGPISEDLPDVAFDLGFGVEEPISAGLSDVAFDPGFGVEEYLGELPEGIDLDFYSFQEEIPGSSKIRSYCVDAEPQKHLQENQVQARPIGVLTFENQCQYTEPLGTSYSALGSESIPNVVHGSCQVVADGVTNEGAASNPQAVGGFPTMSPVSALQPHLDAMAVTSDMVTRPSASNLCPGISTSEQLALKVISLLEQQLREKDTRIAERDATIAERDTTIVELVREVESLGGTSQYLVD